MGFVRRPAPGPGLPFGRQAVGPACVFEERLSMRDGDNVAIRCDGDGVIVAVKVVPGASRDKLAGVLGDCLKIVTSAPPEKGKANRVVSQTLARALGVGVKQIQLVSGPTSPRKEFRITGLSLGDFRHALDRL